MYKANDNSRALAKALYNTNKSFRTCAKVMYNICGVVFPQTRSFPACVSAYIIHIEETGSHTGGCLECDIFSCV